MAESFLTSNNEVEGRTMLSGLFHGLGKMHVKFLSILRNCNETNTSSFVRTNDVIPIAKGLASFKTNGIHFLVANLTFQ
ncbi:MAG: hypothetical protein LKH04_06565, partial [Lachnospiraceae bacterium]|nr:hypothetical protein [Lachnospiraceae bacterium]MCI1452861.1 hypothetical protein [Lachnospiraceae bacterium]